jgi:uncharacterized membrane protein YdfJ with MMPL/SSD domain
VGAGGLGRLQPAVIAAAYGVVVAIFQWQWGSSPLWIDGELPIVSFIPLLMFAILFGLSLDYLPGSARST